MKKNIILVSVLLALTFISSSCGELDSVLGNSKPIELGDIPEFSVEELSTGRSLRTRTSTGITSQFSTDTESNIDCNVAMASLNMAPQLVDPLTNGYRRMYSLLIHAQFYDCVARQQVQQDGYMSYNDEENKFISQYEHGNSTYNVQWEVINGNHIKGSLSNIQNFDDYFDKTKFELDDAPGRKDSLLFFVGATIGTKFHIVETVSNGRKEHRASSREFETYNGMIEFYAHFIEGVGGKTYQINCPRLVNAINAECTAAEAMSTGGSEVFKYYNGNFQFITEAEFNELNVDNIFEADLEEMEGMQSADYFIRGNLDNYFEKNYFD